MKKTNPIIGGIRMILILSSIVTLFLGIINGMKLQVNTGEFFVATATSLLSLVITYIPDFIENKGIMIMPVGLQVLFSGFTFCAIFLGEIMDFYERFSWWDTMLHFISGFMFSMIAYMLFLSFNRDSGVRRQINPVIIVIFAVCFSITCGAIWEIFEFGADSLLGMNMQRWQSGVSNEQWNALQNASNFSNPGLINTMKDIISDAIGSIFSIFFILPLARHNNKYKKASVPQTALLTEYNAAFANIRAMKRTSEATTKTGRRNLGTRDFTDVKNIASYNTGK